MPRGHEVEVVAHGLRVNDAESPATSLWGMRGDTPRAARHVRRDGVSDGDADRRLRADRSQPVPRVRHQPRARSGGSVDADGGRRDRAGDQLSDPRPSPAARRPSDRGERSGTRDGPQPARAHRRDGLAAAARRPRGVNHGYRIGVGIVGRLIVAFGIVAIPLPGPGWLIVIAGLFVLATEFLWAERLLEFTRQHVKRWTDWVGTSPSGSGC